MSKAAAPHSKGRAGGLAILYVLEVQALRGLIPAPVVDQVALPI